MGFLLATQNARKSGVLTGILGAWAWHLADPRGIGRRRSPITNSSKGWNLLSSKVPPK